MPHTCQYLPESLGKRPQVVYEGTNYLHHAWLNVTIWRHRWFAKKFRFGLKCVDGKFVFIRQALQLTDGLGLVTVATLLLLSNLARNGCKKLPKEFKLHALDHIFALLITAHKGGVLKFLRMAICLFLGTQNVSTSNRNKKYGLI